MHSLWAGCGYWRSRASGNFGRQPADAWYSMPMQVRDVGASASEDAICRNDVRRVPDRVVAVASKGSGET